MERRLLNLPSRPSSEGDERLRAEDLELLFTVARILAEENVFSDKAARVLQELSQSLQAWEVTLRVPDEKGQGMRLVATSGPSAALHPNTTLVPSGTGLAEIAFRTGQPAVSNDYLHDPQAFPVMIARGTRSAAALPVRAGGKTVGVVIVASQEIDQFPPHRIRLLSAVVDGLGPLLENARLQEEERLRSEELETLFAVSKVLASPGAFESKVSQALAGC